MAGSTASICYVVGSDLYATNCGDSAAYCLLLDGKIEKLTEDHCTNNSAEVKRCEMAGGEIREETTRIKYCCFEKVVKLGGKPRVFPGGLLVTRSFGDFYAKREFLGGKPDVVISQHGKIAYKNLIKTPVEMIILASDGVWDVLSAEDVASIIHGFGDTIFSSTSTSSQCNKVHPLPSLKRRYIKSFFWCKRLLFSL